MSKLVYFSVMVLMILSACAVTENTVRYTIASKQGDCTGAFPQKCMLVKKGNATDWQYLYSPIEGFTYKEGYEYVLDVKEIPQQNVPADASSIKYIMVKEVSKTAKTSDNLPQTKEESYQCVGKVLSISKEDIGRGGAAGKFSATVVEVKVTSSEMKDVAPGKVIHCELVASPNVKPVKGREYVFKAKERHPAHAKGMYLLETNVLELTR